MYLEGCSSVGSPLKILSGIMSAQVPLSMFLKGFKFCQLQCQVKCQAQLIKSQVNVKYRSKRQNDSSTWYLFWQERRNFERRPHWTCTYTIVILRITAHSPFGGHVTSQLAFIHDVTGCCADERGLECDGVFGSSWKCMFVQVFSSNKAVNFTWRSKIRRGLTLNKGCPLT